jgi:predicted nucleic acid-binding protein
MSVDAFFDANILVYAHTRGDHRTDPARQLLRAGGVVGIQALNEFASVARAKLRMSWAEVEEAIDGIVTLCPNPRPLTIQIHKRALDISKRHNFSIWDSLIVAAAMEAHCTTLFTEDLQHGQVVDGVRIENPFLVSLMP